MRVLEPRAGTVEPAVLMEQLYKVTDLEQRIPLNMNVLDNCTLAPVTLRKMSKAEAEKAAEINILEVRAFGSFGRVYIGGEEKDVETARPAALQALESLTGRVLKK